MAEEQTTENTQGEQEPEGITESQSDAASEEKPQENAQDADQDVAETEPGDTEDNAEEGGEEEVVPDSPDGYKIDFGKEKVSDDYVKQCQGWAHKHKLKPSQASTILAEAAETRAAQMKEARAAHEKAVAEYDQAQERALKKAWGKDYKANMALAEKGLAIAPKGFMKEVQEAGLHNSELLMRLGHEIGKMVSEDTPPKDGAKVDRRGKPGLDFKKGTG